MRVTGLTHLTAVSGAHFAAIALALGFLFRSLGWSGPVRAVTLSVVMAGCVALVFPTASVVRAAWMGGVVVVALSWGRPAQALPALSSAVVGLLLSTPTSRSPTDSHSPCSRRRRSPCGHPSSRRTSRACSPPASRGSSAVPLAAQVACAPVIVLLNPGVGPYAVPANLVALPCAAATTVLGLLGVVVSVALPGLGPFLAYVASIPAWPIAWAAEAFANAPAAWLPWPSGVTGRPARGGVLRGAHRGDERATGSRDGPGSPPRSPSSPSWPQRPPLREAIADGRRTAPPEWRDRGLRRRSGGRRLAQDGPRLGGHDRRRPARGRRRRVPSRPRGCDRAAPDPHASPRGSRRRDSGGACRRHRGAGVGLGRRVGAGARSCGDGPP